MSNYFPRYSPDGRWIVFTQSRTGIMLQPDSNLFIIPSELLPAFFDIGIDREQTCATAEDFDKYKKKYPLWGMPYALPGLTDKEHEIIVEWLKQGAIVTKGPEISENARQVIRRWETFFNGRSLKEMLVFRYIYEHLFMAHIHFATLPDREFYRMVRSKTPPGEKIVVINTARPYDDPGVDQFWYRIQKERKALLWPKTTRSIS